MNNSHSPGSVRRRLNLRKKPTQSRSAKTVEAILEGAARILEARGLEGYTTNEVAARAGVSIGSLYQYFPSKDAITLALVERESAILIQELNAAFLIEDRQKSLRAMIEAAVRHQLRRPKLARLLDFEEERLAAIRPVSSAAAGARAGIVALLQGGFGLSAAQTHTAAPDVMEIVRALTDAAGRREDGDAAALTERIEGAVLGYLFRGARWPQTRNS
jgi:AcrR family transcriptional regulator